VFLDRDIKGDGLPPRTVCLTYDDGPGPQTESLGRYLYGCGIAATFFVIGRQAEGRAGLLRRLAGWGHLVGNHTYSHPGLVALATAGGDVVAELKRADAVIKDFVPGRVTFFRAPYGNWREKEGPESTRDRDVSVVAGLLNRSGQFGRYVGPVNWDINAADYDFWRRGAPARECAEAYLEKIGRVGRGIILMHDGSEEEGPRANNRAAEATRLLVPALRAQGYRFIRLDAVPQVRSAVARGQLPELRS
jgi:peptidoglycan/xylan/chitin deacetylase (PgdA/CDA1 family)